MPFLFPKATNSHWHLPKDSVRSKDSHSLSKAELAEGPRQGGSVLQQIDKAEKPCMELARDARSSVLFTRQADKREGTVTGRYLSDLVGAFSGWFTRGSSFCRLLLIFCC